MVMGDVVRFSDTFIFKDAEVIVASAGMEETSNWITTRVILGLFGQVSE